MLYMHINIYHGYIHTTRWLGKLAKKLHIQAKKTRIKVAKKADKPRAIEDPSFCRLGRRGG